MKIIFFVVVSVLFVTVVLLQQKNATLGSMMGGDGGDEMVQTRRGADQWLHRITVGLAVLLVGGGLVAMFV